MESRQSIVGRGVWRREDPTKNGKVTSIVDLPDGDAMVAFLNRDNVTKHTARLSGISLSPPALPMGREIESIAKWDTLAVNK